MIRPAHPAQSTHGTLGASLGEDRLDPVKILLVDDQPDNLLSAGAVLDSLGEQVIKAESGTEALLRLLDHDFAVIVLDIMMPGMDGFETAAMVRERERSRHTPIIFLTALGPREDYVRQGYSLGAVDYISKPFVPEILRTKVGVFVELSRKSAMLARQSKLLEQRNSELQHAIERSWNAENEVKTLNRHLEQRLEELAEVNRELEAFSYSVSHDLRGPLSRIAGFSQALLEFHSQGIDEEGQLFLRRIENSARRMSELVEDLLRFSRVTRVPMNETRVDMTALVRVLAAELAARDPGRKAEFHIASDVTAWGDPGLLRSALENLLENAWKFTRRRAATVIEFGASQLIGAPVYFIRDNGAGFDMSEASRLFHPFQRLHDDAEFEGTGIGLATVDRVVRRHGGRVWAKAETDGGAVFYFTLRQEADHE
jgi:signal transduction histidine kinase